jgi:hypothetical protein
LWHMLEAAGEEHSHGAILEPQLPSRCHNRARKSMFKIVQSRGKLKPLSSEAI